VSSTARRPILGRPLRPSDAQEHTRRVRRIASAIGWTLLIAVPAGIVSRLMMRAISHFSHQPTDFTWGGTIGIVLLYVLAVLPGALVAAFTTRRWRWLVLAGPTLVLAWIGAGIASTVVEDAPDGLGTGDWIGIWSGTAFIVGMVLTQAVLVVRQVDHSLGRTRAPRVLAS
jgi:peptidoglycan/LPS O-acetylase OafA/YrhL